MGGVVVRPGGAPRLSVPARPVGLATPRVGGVPLATLPRAAPAPAHASGALTLPLRARTSPDEPLLGSADIQSLNDLAGSFDVIRRMRVVPFGLGLVLILVAATLAPMAPLVFLAFPVTMLLELAAKLIFGV